MQNYLSIKSRRRDLLHHSNGQDAISLKKGTTIYTDVLEIKKSPNYIKINATECFPGNIFHPQNMLKIVPGHIKPSVIIECLWQTMNILATV